MTQVCDTGIKVGSEGQLFAAPYYATVLESVATRPGCWNYLRIGIYERHHSDKDRLIGEYTRDFPSFYATFHPFELRGKWYALYSSNYGYTNLMELPSCKDLGGEERDEDGGSGFCPAEFWVPPLSYKERDPLDKDSYCWHFPDRIHGFVAGCYFGGDSSWKIQYLDLSQADVGILVRDERFGDVELPEQLVLSKAVQIRGKSNQVTLTVDKHFNLITGKGDDD